MNGMSAPSRAARLQQWLERVDATLRTQGLESAGQLALQALAESLEHPALLNLAASARFGEGNFEEAARLLRRARTLAPKDPHVLNSLGVCLKALGRSDEALKTYDTALRLDPGLAAAHFNRGAALEEYNDIKGARSAYEQAAALDPDLRRTSRKSRLSGRAGGRCGVGADTGRACPRAFARQRAGAHGRGLRRSAAGDFAAASGQLSALSRDPALTPINRSISSA